MTTQPAQKDSIPFTVLLLRPDYIAYDASYPDTYFTYVRASSPSHALELARAKAFTDDSDNALGIQEPEDYLCLFVFTGFCTIAMGGYGR